MTLSSKPSFIPMVLSLAAGAIFAPISASAEERPANPTVQGTENPDAILQESTKTEEEIRRNAEAEMEAQRRAAQNQPATTPAPTTTDERLLPVDIREDEPAKKRGMYGDMSLGISAGGGVSEFTNANVNDITDVGGAWNARLIFGTRSPIAVEAGYIGTANKIAGLGLDDATLLSNGAEGALRIQVVQVPLNKSRSVLFKPYVHGGFAWKHYSLQGVAVNTSSVNDNDNVYEIPFGGGLAWNFGRFIADQRFDYRPALDNDLIQPTAGRTDNSLQNWSVTARIGVEF